MQAEDLRDQVLGIRAREARLRFGERQRGGHVLPRRGAPGDVDDIDEHGVADGGIGEPVEPEEPVAVVVRAIDVHGRRFCRVRRRRIRL